MERDYVEYHLEFRQGFWPLVVSEEIHRCDGHSPSHRYFIGIALAGRFLVEITFPSPSFGVGGLRTHMKKSCGNALYLFRLR